jgi:transcriptional regulator with PAS, ATPase and Fis domain
MKWPSCRPAPRPNCYAIQQQEIRRVGETISRNVDVRLVAAANRCLADEVVGGRFRADLCYRLDVIHIVIPPLRERPGDVAVLARALWRVAASGVGSSAHLTPSTLDVLGAYAWPGNVRELQNVLAAVAVSAPPRGRIGPEWLPPSVRQSAAAAAPTLVAAREAFERDFVRDAVMRARGNHARAAREMGVSRQGLLKMLLRLGPREDEARP